MQAWAIKPVYQKHDGFCVYVRLTLLNFRGLNQVPYFGKTYKIVA